MALARHGAVYVTEPSVHVILLLVQMYLPFAHAGWAYDQLPPDCAVELVER